MSDCGDTHELCRIRESIHRTDDLLAKIAELEAALRDAHECWYADCDLCARVRRCPQDVIPSLIPGLRPVKSGYEKGGK